MADERWQDLEHSGRGNGERFRRGEWRDEDAVFGPYGREPSGYRREGGGAWRDNGGAWRDMGDGRFASGRGAEWERDYEGRPSRRGGYERWDYGRDYGAPSYRGYGRGGDDRNLRGEQDRGWLDRAADEVSSWFGDEEAQRRRSMDEIGNGRRGLGPKGYVRPDERIREDVCDRLCDDAMVDASDIEVAVAGSEVTLTGTVESRRERRRAEECAERVTGVTHVQNNLRVAREGTSRTGIAPPTPPFI